MQETASNVRASICAYLCVEVDRREGLQAKPADRIHGLACGLRKTLILKMHILIARRVRRHGAPG